VSALAIHLACLALVGLDFVARTWRTQLFLLGLGRPLPFREVFVQSALGETASSLTPLRAGSEPARIWAMVRQGVPARVGVVAAGVELLATSAVIVVVALVLGLTIAQDWWAITGPELLRAASRGWRWILAVAVLTLLAWALVRRHRPALLHAASAELAAARGHLREIPVWVYAASVPVTLLNIGARVAILPLLAQSLAEPPPLAATVVGSFVLLHAQAIIPTPAGAGAIELGFLSGAAGDLGAGQAELLVAWRLYTTVLGTVLGIVAAGWRFRGDAVGFVVRRMRRTTVGDESV
jgi:uncharacterized membrane protein YbhN (UPF0104 family)